MPVVTSTLEIDLIDDVSKNAKAVAAALEKTQKDAVALQKALSQTGVSDRMQKSLAALGASASHITAVSQRWKEYAEAEGIAGKADAERTKEQIANAKNWERVETSSLRAVMAMERAQAKAAVHTAQQEANDRKRLDDQMANDAIKAAQRAADEKKRIAEQVVRDARRAAEQEDRDRRRAAERALRDAARDTKTQARAVEREQKEAQRHAERLAHEQARTDNTVAGVGALYAAHSAAHAAASVGERYREFDKERRYAKAVMGLTDEQQRPLVEQAIRGSASSKYNDIEWLAAQRSLAARGYKADQVMGFTPTSALLGQAFDVSMEEGVKLFEGAMLGFKKKAGTREEAAASAGRTADLEVKAGKISGMDANDIQALYARGAPAARNAGLTEEQMLAFGSALKKVNIGGDEAATAFVALTKNLQAPTKEARTALHAAGVDFTKFQKLGKVDQEGFFSEVSRNFGVKLSSSVRAHLGRVFADPKLMADPDKLMPAVTRYLRGALGGKDAKSLDSITSLIRRYRDASMEAVDTQGFMAAIMGAMKKNPALANAVFGSKQGGKISTGLDPELFKHLLDELQNYSEGYAQQVSDARMAGFDGELSKFTNQIAILETSIGRAFDNGGSGGFLTDATWAARKFAEMLADANPKLLRAGSEAVLLAGGFAALKGVDFFRGGFGIKASAAALDRSALLLDEAAVKLGASSTTGKIASAEGAAANAAAAGGAAATSAKSKLIKGAGQAVMMGMIGEAVEGAVPMIEDYLTLPQGKTSADLVAARQRDLAARNAKIADPNTGFFGRQWNRLGAWVDRSDLDLREAPHAAETTPIDGHRAAGGPVGRGGTYLVGERGPELFTPGASGQITSSRNMLAALGDGGIEGAAAERALHRAVAGGAKEGVAAALEQARLLAGSGGASGGGAGSAGDAIASGVDRAHGGRYGFMHRGAAGVGRDGVAPDGSPMPRSKGGGTTDPTTFKGLLFRGESAGDPGIYNYKSGGRYRAGHFNADEMTIGELMARQHAGGIFAAGKYQMIPGTVAEGVRKLGLKASDKFDSDTQDRLFTDYLAGSKRPAISAFITGKGSLIAAQRAASYEWASVGDPDKQGTVSHYGRDHASISPQAMGAALQKAREQYQALLKQPGMTPENARRAALLGIADPTQPGAKPDPARAQTSPAGAEGITRKAMSLLGANAQQAAVALGSKMTPGLWCADFVNGVLKSQGLKSSGSSLANSFARYGTAVGREGIRKGDILVEGGHVGIATGETDARGRIGMVSGNYAHKVSRSFEDAARIIAARHVPGGQGDSPALAGKGGQDDPLGLRQARERRHDGEHPLMAALHGGITPAVDNRHLHETVALLREIRQHSNAINVASVRHRGAGGTRVAGLGARTRGGYGSGGLSIG